MSQAKEDRTMENRLNRKRADIERMNILPGPRR
jgi:hypothetical protein